MTTDGLVLPAGSRAPGARLHVKSWAPSGSARAVVVLVHGYAEHLGRYEHVAARLTAAGYAVYALDHWGHGSSDGVPGFVPAFSVYLDGVDALLARVKSEHPAAPRFLLGHSMGGLIVASFLLRHQQQFAGAILSGPAVKPTKTPSAVTILLGRILSTLAPRVGVIQLDATQVSRDPKVVAAYLADPLVYKGRVGARLGAQMLAAMDDVQANAGRITLPLLLLHGERDGLAAPEGSRFLYERAGSSDKTLKLYAGLYHEIFNEPEQQAVLDDLVGWLAAHLRP
jgi:alpha-beta hydrolase superfamily lysophospholipase